MYVGSIIFSPSVDRISNSLKPETFFLVLVAAIDRVKGVALITCKESKCVFCIHIDLITHNTVPANNPKIGQPVDITHKRFLTDSPTCTNCREPTPLIVQES